MIRRGKYNARRTVVDGIQFHSAKEARRFQELKLLEKAGEVVGLILQPHYELLAPLPVGHPLAGKRLVALGDYIADFSYVDKRSGDVVIEDVKGFKTPLYRWKKKHVEAQYGIVIRET